jgi:hypothetical protein
MPCEYESSLTDIRILGVWLNQTEAITVTKIFSLVRRV